MTIGESIKFYRKQNKLTQKQLANMCNLAEITIRQYEADKYIPKIGNLQKISAALNIPLTILMNVKGDVPWTDIAVEFPNAPVFTRGDNVLVSFSDPEEPEENAYILQITVLLESLNTKGLQDVYYYLKKVLNNKDYIKKTATTTTE